MIANLKTAWENFKKIDSATSLTLTDAISASGGKFRTSATTVTGSATDKGYAIFGTSGGTQIQIDDNEIQAMNAAAAAAMSINGRGGRLTLGSGSAADLVINSQTLFQAAYRPNSSYVYTTTTLDGACNTYFVDASAGSLVLNLPSTTATNVFGRPYTIFKMDSTTNTITVTPNGSETIDGASSVVLGGNSGKSRLVLISDGVAGWRIAELYEEGTYTGTLTGCTTSPTVTVAYVKNGKTVTVRTSAVLSATSNTTACTVTGCPSHLFPATTQNVTIDRVLDNTLDNMGFINIGTGGVWSPFFWSAINTRTATFTNAGTKGIGLVTMTYALQ